MPRLEIKRTMDDADIAAVTDLLAVASDADGHRALGEHQWLDLVQGGREGFAGLVASEPGHGHPVGYAQLTRGHDRDGSWALELVVDPHHRDGETDIARQLLQAALALVADEGGGHVHFWAPKPTPRLDAAAASVGLRKGRELLQLRRSLPLEESADLAVRPFRPDSDGEAWLAVNNRAFRHHAEQGGWNMETLHSRQAQEWFDPEGFLVHHRGGRMAAFCWTKVHRDHDPRLGEIYVIAVDPDFEGLGLGRAITVAGLGWLSDQGIKVGMLYVDRDNTRAVRMYESLGFSLDHVDQAYVADI